MCSACSCTPILCFKRKIYTYVHSPSTFDRLLSEQTRAHTSFYIRRCPAQSACEISNILQPTLLCRSSPCQKKPRKGPMKAMKKALEGSRKDNSCLFKCLSIGLEFRVCSLIWVICACHMNFIRDVFMCSMCTSLMNVYVLCVVHDKSKGVRDPARPAKHYKQPHTTYRTCMWCIVVLVVFCVAGRVARARPDPLSKTNNSTPHAEYVCGVLLLCFAWRVGSRARGPTRRAKQKATHTKQHMYFVCF